jgi:putative ABC transport system substrate-binding protein
VDVIVAAGGTVTALAAKAATATVPTVVLSGDDPVAHGLAASINRPGGNITGVVQLVLASEAKRLELLRELVPQADTIAALFNPAGASADRQTASVQSAAHALGLRLRFVSASGDSSLDQAIAEAASVSKALLVAGDPYFLMRSERIVALAAQHALPAMYFFREFTLAGGLASYSSNLADAYYQLGVYTGRVLKGASPADMPMTQQTDKLELAINLRTAKAPASSC